MTQFKVFLTGFAAVFLLALAAFPAGANEKYATGDMAIGKADAPLTIVEYASMTCPHCADFHTGNLEKLKERYIDTGKVRLIFREFPLDGAALRAAMLARCAGPKRYFGMIEVMFRQQDKWARSADPVEALAKIARLAGMSKDDVETCMQDEKLMESILQTRLEGNKEFDVNSTPSFVIEGTTYPGDRSWREWEEVLARHLDE